MTAKEVETRLANLEKQVAEINAKIERPGTKGQPWWITQAGIFANDPVFDDIVRLGREYRESVRPKGKKSTKSKEK